MNRKKTERADLENKKGLFIQIGLVFSLMLTFIAFEYTRQDLKDFSLGTRTDGLEEVDIIPITRQELVKPPEPPKPKVILIDLKIVEDDIELDDNLDFDAFDANQNDAIKIAQVIGNKNDEEEDEKIFLAVEEMPSFKGGTLETFRNYIQSTVEYPEVAIDNSISGVVHVTFIVNRQGEVSSIKILRGVDPSLDNAVTLALQKAPKWQPGLQRGKPVNVMFTIPVKFVMN
jgi:periplasmic protein TonB